MSILAVLAGLLGTTAGGICGPITFTGRQTGLPLPRFVSLGQSPANMRVGPGIQYLIKWVYIVPRIPLEIINEYDNWRKVRDAGGVTGWMHHSLLSGQRMGTIAPWQSALQMMRKTPSPKALIVAKLQPNVIIQLQQCDGVWCKVSAPKSQLSGYIRQTAIWGTYPGEIFGNTAGSLSRTLTRLFTRFWAVF